MRRRLDWGSSFSRRGSGAAASARRLRMAAEHARSGPTGLPRTRRPDVERERPSGRAGSAVWEGDHASHLARL
ncbi:hypothetical protein CLOP_g25425 [Closterium sp. NIES-67]|nr:hypothetical protein CLOP_g25425 [Closterium sp. NIES-67]